MSSVNKAIVLGRLGQDPEIRYTNSGTAVATLSVATSRKYKDKQSEKVEETEWHRVSLFDRLAEIAGEYLKKGSIVYIEGRLKTNKFSDKQGIERYQTVVVGESMQLLGGNQQGGGQQASKPKLQAKTTPHSKSSTGTGFDDMGYDIQF